MSESEVRAAAANVVAAFSHHDTEAYFAGFAPEATFIFHSTPEVLESRDAYRSMWASWEVEGFHVLECTSSNGSVRMLGEDVGVFFHDVDTTIDMAGERLESRERETIVFQRVNGAWLAVHEHLSVDPRN
jgi:uncharacterized protein (TIGR02246 family)